MKTDTSHNQLYTIDPIDDLDTGVAFDLLGVDSSWAETGFAEIGALELLGEDGLPVPGLTLSAEWAQNPETGLFHISALSVSGTVADFAALNGQAVSLQGIDGETIAIDTADVLSALFALPENQGVYDLGESAIAAVSSDDQQIIFTFELPAEFQGQDPAITSDDIVSADGSPLPTWVQLLDQGDGTLVLRASPPRAEMIDGLGILINGNPFTLSFNDAQFTYFEYTPDMNGAATEELTYTITDHVDGVSTGTLTINILDADVPPNAVDDVFDGVEDQAIHIAIADILANDSDNDGDPLTLLSVAAVSGGTVEIVGDAVLFTPEAGFIGEAVFTYVVTDSNQGPSTATVTVNVLPANSGEGNAPVANPDAFTGLEDQFLVISAADLLANDTDADGDALSFVSVQFEGDGGSATSLNGDTIYLTPSENFNGEATFTYYVTDGSSVSAGTITVNFEAVNDAPVAANDSGFVTEEDQPLILSPAVLLINDSDIDSESISLVSVSAPSNGTVEYIDGQIIFTPNENYFGNASFEYTIQDSEGAEATATAFISVTPANDLPVAVDDGPYEFNEDGSIILSIADLYG